MTIIGVRVWLIFIPFIGDKEEGAEYRLLKRITGTNANFNFGIKYWFFAFPFSAKDMEFPCSLFIT